MDILASFYQLLRERIETDPFSDLFREPLIGCASAADPLFDSIADFVGPHHLKPVDLLPEVGSVISCFIPYSAKVVESNRQAGEAVSEEWALAYLESRRLADSVSREAVGHRIAVGLKAAGVPPEINYDDVALRASWSHRSAAYIAGLGRFGLNNLLITPSGCAGRLFTLFISARLEPGRPMSDELCLNSKTGKCGYCLSHCPQEALSKEENFDRFKCHERLLEVSGDFNYLNRLCDVCGKCAIGPCALSA